MTTQREKELLAQVDRWLETLIDDVTQEVTARNMLTVLAKPPPINSRSVVTAIYAPSVQYWLDALSLWGKRIADDRATIIELIAKDFKELRSANGTDS